jgi:hypothetical protein
MARLRFIQWIFRGVISQKCALKQRHLILHGRLYSADVLIWHQTTTIIAAHLRQDITYEDVDKISTAYRGHVIGRL